MQRLAERLGAPVVQTANARGLLHAHPLCVPASPSLKAVRALMADADLVIAAGTEFGPTDYDGYSDGGFVLPANLIRIDIGADQLARRAGDGRDPGRLRARRLRHCLARSARITPAANGRREPRRRGAKGGLCRTRPGLCRRRCMRSKTIRDALPGAIIVGDSTQPIYAANLYYDHDRPGGWFNAATGFGALGYGPPAAIGAALAMPGAPVVCLTGDGGFQFTLPELGAALDAPAPVDLRRLEQSGYREIETSMRDVGVEPVGVSPAPPDFCKLADAYGISAERLAGTAGLADALKRARATGLPHVIEITID